MAKLLEGIKVVELGNFVAAPSCTVIMGYLGADVIKVEPPISDTWRSFGATQDSKWNIPDESPIWENYNSNKRNITIDLTQDDGREVLFKLLEDADVFVTNTRVKALKKLGIDYDSIKDRYPKLIYAAVTGFGMEGPEKNDPGYDTVAFWARSGLMSDLVPIGGLPLTTPGAVGDSITGLGLFGIINAALVSRAKTGKGDFVEVSLYGMGIWVTGMMSTLVQPGFDSVYPTDRYLGNPVITSYRTKDNEWFTLTIVTASYEKFFPPIVTALGRPDLAADPRFASYESVNKAEWRAEAFHILEDMFAEHTWPEIKAACDSVGCTCQKMSHYKDVLSDEQAWANNYVKKTVYEKTGNEYIQPLPPLRSANNGAYEVWQGHYQGEDNIAILKELGYSDEEAKAYDAKYTSRK